MCHFVTPCALLLSASGPRKETRAVESLGGLQRIGRPEQVEPLLFPDEALVAPKPTT